MILIQKRIKNIQYFRLQGRPLPSTTSKHSGISRGNLDISQQISPPLPDKELRPAYEGHKYLTEISWRSHSDTQTTRVGDWEVRTVSEGSGEALSSEFIGFS